MVSTRSIRANISPDLGHDGNEKVVRFDGLTFHQLRERLMAAHLPGVTQDSFIEVKLDDGNYVCLLDDEILPEGELHVNVFNFPSGNPPLSIDV